MSTINQAFISIIIPAYNYAHTLERAILSVSHQLDEHSELIVINDGSTDDTEIVLQKFRKPELDISIICKNNEGLAATRNVGIKHAKGDFLVFLDADDELAENAISIMRNHLVLNHETHFAIGGHVSIFPDGSKKRHLPKQLPETPHKKLKSYLLDKSISISNGACLMHKSIFKKYLYPESFRNSEDISMFSFVLVNFTCTTIPFPLAKIYKHADSLRHNASYSENIGLSLVDEVFNIERMPKELQNLRNMYLVQRLLSLSRVCHEGGRHQKCKDYFSQAFQISKSVIFKWSYFKKHIISSLKLCFIR